MDNNKMMKCKNLDNRIDDMSCPYNGLTVCLASLSSMQIDSFRKELCCFNEGFDECPIFLAKILRR